MKTRIIFFVVLIVIISLFTYLGLKPQISFNTALSAEKCDNLNSDDCWHALAHQIGNKEFCYNISDNEAREHCLEHIPK